MYIKYGSFSFAPHEAGLSVSVRATQSPRGFSKTRKVQFVIEGEVVSADQYAVTTRLQEIQTAFNVNYQDIGLYHDDNSPTQHVLISNHIFNLTGNQVRQLDFPQTVGGEYTTGRKFAYAIDAELAAAESNILEWRDSIKFRGNAGPEWRWRRNPQWGWYPELVAPNSLQIVEHTGMAVGMFSRPLPPTPFYQPPFELNHLREVDKDNGKRWPQGYTDFQSTWRYIYALPVANDLLQPTLP